MDVHELTAAYALDALDPEDRDRYEAHLGRCAECREQLAQLQDAAGALAYGVDTPPPPPALRERILAAAEPAEVIPFRPRHRRALTAVAAVAACAAVVLGVWAVSLHRSLAHERAALRVAQIQGAHGVVAVDGSGHGVLMLSGLARTAPDKTYEAWVIRDGRATSAGLFQGGTGVTVVRLTQRVPRGAVIAATVERAGGVVHSTQKPVFSATT